MLRGVVLRGVVLCDVGMEICGVLRGVALREDGPAEFARPGAGWQSGGIDTWDVVLRGVALREDGPMEFARPVAGWQSSTALLRMQSSGAPPREDTATEPA